MSLPLTLNTNWLFHSDFEIYCQNHMFTVLGSAKNHIKEIIESFQTFLKASFRQQASFITLEIIIFCVVSVSGV